MADILPVVSLTLRCAVMALVLIAAWEDVRHMRIRNDISLAVVLLFVPMIFLLPFKLAGAHVIVAVVFLAAGAAMFFARLIGGGDAKLIAALGLWPQLTQIGSFLLIMTVCGGILALAGIGLKRATFTKNIAEKMPVDGWIPALARGETVVPYGVAIAVACAATLFR
ncbi:MAG: prepilin peptidase [Rhodospirillales bacterium]|nr:prepilin peptidase [Alphaproteobacteria bacterium]MCB9986181.1 prepilin peptidase [Rhodospirillales bacterium]USO07262.1 MAG: prepilin peptidase [Rhodospirillales bacterium]